MSTGAKLTESLKDDGVLPFLRNGRKLIRSACRPWSFSSSVFSRAKSMAFRIHCIPLPNILRRPSMIGAAEWQPGLREAGCGVAYIV